MQTSRYLAMLIDPVLIAAAFIAAPLIAARCHFGYRATRRIGRQQ